MKILYSVQFSISVEVFSNIFLLFFSIVQKTVDKFKKLHLANTILTKFKITEKFINIGAIPLIKIVYRYKKKYATI